MKPKLKRPGTQHLKLKCDELLSSFAFKYKFAPLHHGSALGEPRGLGVADVGEVAAGGGRGLHSFPFRST